MLRPNNLLLRLLEAYTTPLPETKILQNSLRPENIIGRGIWSIVYSIDDHPDLCIKAPDSLRPPIDKLFTGLRTYAEEPALKGTNYGQPIAEFKHGRAVISVLRRQTGTPLGVPEIEWPGSYGYKNNQIENDQKHENSVRAVSRMPQKAYDNLLKNVRALNDRGFDADTMNTANLLLDEKAGEFHFVDVLEFKSSGIQPASGIYEVLVDNWYSEHYRGENMKELKTLRRSILSNLVDATERDGRPFFPTCYHVDETLNTPEGWAKKMLDMADYDLEDPQRAAMKDRLFRSGSAVAMPQPSSSPPKSAPRL